GVVSLCVLSLAGCAARDQTADEEVSQRILRENEKRIHSLESTVSALNSQIAQLNNRVYEVRNNKGQKTNMTVVPVAGGAGAAVPVSTPSSSTVSAPAVAPGSATAAVKPAGTKTPTARKINPAAPPAPLQSREVAKKTPPPVAQATSPRVETPVAEVPVQSGGSGQIGGTGDLGLPPAEIPEQGANRDIGNTMTAHASSVTIAPPSGNTSGTAIPVPLIPQSDLSLPPEHPDLPPASLPEAAPAPASATPAAAPAPRQTSATSLKGEEAAYNAALRAARSGNTQEGIRMFRDFLQKYPNGKYAANADFWIGECLYSQGKYQDALNQFQVVNSTFPKHHKNADALLKAGMTMAKMGNQAGAKEKYNQVIASFPNTDAAKRARALGGR
ncbi:MAG: tol-pal system protein YbgF, partial [Desulfovibrio sp.]|nr:tol-pal system protein YbgF [Desulfovibrio sp.]